MGRIEAHALGPSKAGPAVRLEGTLVAITRGTASLRAYVLATSSRYMVLLKTIPSPMS